MIILDSVSKSFDGKLVISNFSYTFEDDKMYALIGESGSGKTTLLNIICSIYTPDEGILKINKQTSFSCVFQEDRLFEHLSAIDNVKVATKIKDKSFIESELSKLLPFDELNKPVSELSGGMRRRVCIVRALLNPGNVIILDEPFSVLYENNINIAFSYIQEKRGNRCLIMTSHNFNFPSSFEKVNIK